MSPRYLFLCPDRKSASGGIAVIYDIVRLLNREGYEAIVVHESSGAGYPDYSDPVPGCFTPHVRRVRWRYAGPRDKLKRIKSDIAAWRNRKTLEPLKLRSDDVIIVPEFMMAEALEAFEGRPIAVLVQNPFAVMRSYQRARHRGLDPAQQAVAWFGMSEVCQTHLETLVTGKLYYSPVSMKPHEFDYRDEKDPLITYMPRKRPWEAEILHDALQRRGKIGGYRLEAIDNLPRVQVAEVMARSRIFISLMKDESLGFPAAEAMASGCIVVGFDGLGGAEFFDTSTGVPVVEGDIAGLVAAVERTVAEYETDPARLDEMRQRAARLVKEKYSVESFETTFLEAWRQFHATMQT